MSLTEILRRTFTDGYATMSIRITDILVCLLVTALVALYIFVVYRRITRNTFYNKNFNLSLLALAIIIAAIILTIQSNIVISLGMVGALSIVRFRTAVKDPMDLVFLFWSISVGIICGAGFALVAVIASLVVSIIIFFAAQVPSSKSALVLLVNAASYESEEEIMSVVKELCKVYKVKARNLTKDHLDMAIEVAVPNQGELVRKLMEVEQVYSASLVSHEGDVTV